jgi:hypothetical protein
MTPVRSGLRIGVAAVALIVTLGTAGCVQNLAPLPTPGGSSAGSPTGPTSTATPAPAPAPTPTNAAFVEACGILLTAAQVYAYNPNFVVDPHYAPKAGTIAAAIKAQRGQTCGWINETSGVELEVAAATPTSSALASANAAAAHGTPISTNGEQGYFTTSGGVGSAQFFFGSLWLDVSSRDFTSADDAAAIYPVVVHNQLTAGG